MGGNRCGCRVGKAEERWGTPASQSLRDLSPEAETITVDYAYDVGNRVSSVEFEPGIGFSYEYDNVGYHRSTHLNEGSKQELVWGWESSDENTSLNVESYGAAPAAPDRTRTTRWFDPATGRLESSTTAVQGTNVQAYSFGWTPAGDLDYRLDSIHGQAEEFEHDALHRLTESEVDGSAARTYGYDALGNFTQKDGVGTYHYDTAGTRLLYTTNGSTSTTYTHDANGAVENFGSTSISWTSFGKARTISQAGTTRQMSYDADGARVIRETSNRGGFTVTPHPLGASLRLRRRARGACDQRRGCGGGGVPLRLPEPVG